MSSRHAPALVALLVLVGLGLVGLAGIAWLATSDVPAAQATPVQGAPAPRPAETAQLTPPPVETTPEVVVEPPPPPHRLACLSAADRSPVRGVQLYVEAKPVAGPSNEAGLLEVAPTVGSNRLQAWAPGWGPTRLPNRRPLPDEVLLEPATSGVQVWVRSTDPAARITRTRLVRQGTPTRPDQPWAPRLRLQGRLSASAAQLPAGRYHLYLWLARDSRAPRAVPHQEIELVAGRTITVEIDADAPREGDSDR
jgi:hypothetical protein